MSTTTSPEVTYHSRSIADTRSGYRTLADLPIGTLIAPHRVTIEVDVTGEPGLGRVEFDVELAARRYVKTRLVASPTEPAMDEPWPESGEPRAGLDLEALRRLPFARFVGEGIGHQIVLTSVEGPRIVSERPWSSPDPLWQVAISYTIAFALGESPTKAVADELGISAGAAAQRVKRARDAGFLPATTRGRTS